MSSVLLHSPTIYTHEANTSYTRCSSKLLVTKCHLHSDVTVAGPIYLISTVPTRSTDRNGLACRLNDHTLKELHVSTMALKLRLGANRNPVQYPGKSFTGDATHITMDQF